MDNNVAADCDTDREERELRRLLDSILRHYGYDFRNYAPASLKRRVWKCVRDEQLGSIAELREKILVDPTCMEHFLLNLSVQVTALFRDPGFYRAFRAKVVPYLRTYPFIRIWHVGCSTGEEVYSMAILLEEERLLDQTLLYATDINEAVLQQAREGIFPLKVMRDYTRNYLEAGGTTDFSYYYAARYDHAIFRPRLRANIVWAQHNLVSDSSFNEFNVILCRNVLIYFNKALAARVHKLLYESLGIFGVLGLGKRESIRFTPLETSYEVVDEQEKLFRRIR